MNAEHLANQTREQDLQQQRVESDEAVAEAKADADVRLRTMQAENRCLRVELAESNALKPQLEQLEQQLAAAQEESILSSSNLVSTQTDLSQLRSTHDDETVQHSKTKMELESAMQQLNEGRAELQSVAVQHGAEVGQIQKELQQARASASAAAIQAQNSASASTAANRESLLRKKVQALQAENESLKRQLQAPMQQQQGQAANFWR